MMRSGAREVKNTDLYFAQKFDLQLRERMKKLRRGQDRELGEFLTELAAFGGVAPHEVGQVALVPGHQVCRIHGDGQIGIGLVLGIARQCEDLRGSRQVDGGSLDVAYKSVDALRGELGVAGSEFRAQRNVAEFCEDGITEEENRLAGEYSVQASRRWPAPTDERLDEHHGIEDDTRRSQGCFR